VPLDVIFDLGAGARITDQVSGEVRVTTADERTALHVVFAFDGTTWRADEVAPVSDENAAWARLPTPVPPGSPCGGFERDPVAAPFDDAPRPWCDGDGRGREIRAQQLAMITRYPCDAGHAAILTVGRPLGAAIDRLARWEYVRDPAGEFLAQGWLTAPFEGAASLPADAAYTGWTNGNVDLWTSPNDLDRAVYLVRGDVVERWPRAADEWGVIDCN
jgi:hypothetical protein